MEQDTVFLFLKRLEDLGKENAMMTWYALNTKPQSEKYVSDVLISRGLEPYLPLWHPPRRDGRGNEARPYFPGYLFARADLAEVGISSLQYLPGVRHVVCSGDQPTRVDEVVINELRGRLAELDRRLLDAAGNPISRGDRVVITGGFFAGYEAIFDRCLPSGERVRVLIDFLQQRAPMEIQFSFVRRKVVSAFQAIP